MMAVLRIRFSANRRSRQSRDSVSASIEYDPSVRMDLNMIPFYSGILLRFGYNKLAVKTE
jgi:hypothetical protein